MIQKVDTLIVGAGVIGSSVAMHLAQAGMTQIRVIDFDLEGALSSSELNAGGVRATWVHPINIQLSQTSIEYFSSVSSEVGYRACGYLWLHPPERMKAALQARETQLQLGWQVDALDLPALQRKVPFIDKLDGIAGALFSPRDGLINPNLIKLHYRNRGRSLGVVYEDRALLRSISYHPDESPPLRILAEKFEKSLSWDEKLGVMSQDLRQPQSSDTSSQIPSRMIEFRAERIINCAGPWAAQVASLLGYSCPSYPLRRQICIFDCKGLDLTPYGMMIDTSGVYFHPEASNGLAGHATVGEPPGVNYAYDGEGWFTDVIWPALYERSSYFERLKHVTGWSGLYEVSPDDCAILGKVSSSNVLDERVFEAHSFSGHGVMQSYGAGLALAERIMKGKYETFDLDCLSGDRFESKKLINENLII